MAQLPECGVCMEPYDDSVHVPRVLSCGHSFCEPCLTQLQSTWRPSSLLTNMDDSKISPGSASSGAIIRCPECSQRTRLPFGGRQSLPKNVELLRLLPSLTKEGIDCTTGTGTEPGELPLKESVEKKGNSNRDHTGEEKEAGIRASSRRRPRAKGRGKQRVESNCSRGDLTSSSSSSGSRVDTTWVLPCDLFSENVVSGDVRRWILPEKAVKLRGEGEESRVRPVKNNSKGCLLLGEIILEQNRLSSSVPVTLLHLTELALPQEEETLTYENCILKAWVCCRSELQTELLILVRISLLGRRLCSVLGIWMDRQQKAIYLVSQVPAQENFSPWETIKLWFQVEELGRIESKTDENALGLDQSSLVEEEMARLELGNELQAQERNTSAMGEREQILSRVGSGLCEAILEAHSQGLILGLLSPNCFVVDRFGSLLVEFNAALSERSSLHDWATRLSGSSGFNLETGCCGSVGHHSNPQDSGRNCWQYMSPEALALLIKKLALGKDPKRTPPANSPCAASDSLPVNLSCKTDVWSLGCLLLEFVCRKAPFDGLSFSDVVQKVLVEREKPGDFLSMLGFSLEPSDADSGALKGKQSRIKVLANLLSKCFEFDPYERPQLDDLCTDLLELGLPKIIHTIGARPEHHLQSEPAGRAQEKYWVLSLESWHVGGPYGKGSQKHTLDKNGAADIGRDLRPSGLDQKGSLEGHLDYVTALVICGDHLLSASFDKTIHVWSLEDHKLLQTLGSHSHTVAALAVDQNTFTCFSGDTGGGICAWKLGLQWAQPLIATWQDHDDWRYTGVASLAVSPDQILYSGSGDRTIKAWSLENFNLLSTMEGHKLLVSALLVDGELLYSGSWDGTIHVWWRNDHSLMAVLGAGSNSNYSLGSVRSLCMFDSYLLAGRDSGAIQVWRDEECLTTVKAHDTVVSALYIEGDFLYTGSWDEHLKAWKVDEFPSDPSPTLVRKCVSALSSLVSDGDHLYAGLADRAIKFYSLLDDTMNS